jgi:hypothetical protein
MWSGVERRGTGDWCPMASHAAPPAVLSSGKSGGCRSVGTAAGRLTSINRSLGSCTSDGARRDGDGDGGAAAEGGGGRRGQKHALLQRQRCGGRRGLESRVNLAQRLDGSCGQEISEFCWAQRRACKVHGSASPRRASRRMSRARGGRSFPAAGAGERGGLGDGGGGGDDRGVQR